jgi:hypothetical protein
MRLLVIAPVMLMMIACSSADEFDRVVSSPDETYVSELAVELDATGIEFRARRDGSIAYRSRDEDAFRQVDERVKKAIAAGADAKKRGK